eukprot:TRINITY_DN2206_c0_g3_i2.p1 TRINITY_DN2206_c0_g3~~TRINITY_DN2206_c0_g3_i2.p1  ORF type:complete len:422 (-),score=141.01 TRINITY_DN2206_c0_g3_i2:68-1333(-)
MEDSQTSSPIPESLISAAGLTIIEDTIPTHSTHLFYHYIERWITSKDPRLIVLFSFNTPIQKFINVIKNNNNEDQKNINNKKIIIVDFFSDPLGWLKNSQHRLHQLCQDEGFIYISPNDIEIDNNNNNNEESDIYKTKLLSVIDMIYDNRILHSGSEERIKKEKESCCWIGIDNLSSVVHHSNSVFVSQFLKKLIKKNCSIDSIYSSKVNYIPNVISGCVAILNRDTHIASQLYHDPQSKVIEASSTLFVGSGSDSSSLMVACGGGGDPSIIEYDAETIVVITLPPPSLEQIEIGRSMLKQNPNNRLLTILHKRQSGRVARALEGYGIDKNNQLIKIKVAKTNISINTASEQKIDPSSNLTFNLKLTEEQKKIKQGVVLPYTHHLHKKTKEEEIEAKRGTIFFEIEDDDYDSEDPDDDLDI